MQSNIWKDKKEKLGRKSLNFNGYQLDKLLTLLPEK